jgi:hypothetical protein
MLNYSLRAGRRFAAGNSFSASDNSAQERRIHTFTVALVANYSNLATKNVRYKQKNCVIVDDRFAVVTEYSSISQGVMGSIPENYKYWSSFIISAPQSTAGHRSLLLLAPSVFGYSHTALARRSAQIFSQPGLRVP